MLPYSHLHQSLGQGDSYLLVQDFQVVIGRDMNGGQ